MSFTSEQKQRKRILCFDRQGGACYYCSRPLQIARPNKPDYATIEHLKQVCEGGTWANDNIAVACVPCNNSLGIINNIVKECIVLMVKNKYDKKYVLDRVLKNMDKSLRKMVKTKYYHKGYAAKPRTLKYINKKRLANCETV